MSVTPCLSLSSYRKLARPLAALVIVTSLVGCAPNQGSQNNGQGGETVGTVGGAVIGGLVGSLFGKGSGQLVGVALGTLAGGLIGNKLGHMYDQLNSESQAKMYNTTEKALETAQPGQALPWETSQASGNIQVYAVKEVKKGRHKKYCREYQQTITIGGKKEQAYGYACRQPDGHWKIEEGDRDGRHRDSAY